MGYMDPAACQSLPTLYDIRVTRILFLHYDYCACYPTLCGMTLKVDNSN